MVGEPRGGHWAIQTTSHQPSLFKIKIDGIQQGKAPNLLHNLGVRLYQITGDQQPPAVHSQPFSNMITDHCERTITAILGSKLSCGADLRDSTPVPTRSGTDHLQFSNNKRQSLLLFKSWKSSNNSQWKSGLSF
jgi:hypothetical protein